MPPLHLLDAFVSAAESLSFSDAADELHVSPSAISHRLRLLESRLGAPLFRRHHRGIGLTAFGESYYQAVGPALQSLRSTHRDTVTQHLPAAWTLRVPPVFGEVVIEAHMPVFRRRFPGVVVRVEAESGRRALEHGEVDAAVLVGTGHWQGAEACRLLDVTVVPVCSPGLAAELHTTADVLAAPLLHLRNLPDAWAWWARLCGQSMPGADTGRWFQDHRRMLEAAERGEGVALTLMPLVAPRLRAQRLVQPVAGETPLPEGFYLVTRPGQMSASPGAELVAWLQAHVPCASPEQLSSLAEK